MSDPVDELARALDLTGEVISAIGAEQWANSTPCPEWDVRELVSHLVGGNRLYTAAVRGEQPPPDAQAPVGDLPAAYRDSGRELVAAFRRPGALEESCTVPIGAVPGIAALHLRITELLVHGWDLAMATGQPAHFPDDLAEQELTFSRTKLGDIPPGRQPFAPSQPVAEDAPAIDRLVACLGRSVTSAGSTP
jgi:uncharacterized protein (TIGR03086 family)